MKKICISLIFLGIAGNSFASSIYITGESHRVWGQVHPWEYDILSESHQSVHKDNWDEAGWSTSETSPFSVYAEAANSGYAHAGAQSSYFFGSEEDYLHLSYECYASNWDGISTGSASILLADLSNGADIYYKFFDPAGPEPWYYIDIIENISVPIDKTHQYVLTLTAFASAVEGTNTARMAINIQPVPEPASIMLFGLGLAGILGWRQKKK